MNKFLFFIMLSSIIFSQPNQIIGQGLTGQDLLEYVISNYKTSTTLGYNTARDVMYGTIDLKEDDQLSGIYTGYTITLDTSQDPSTNAYEQGINCEHTWPQSMGAGEEPQRSDLHHLFPCKSNVNSSRGNDPYGDIPDEDTDIWYRNDYSQGSIPEEFIDEYAEKYNPPDPSNERFEPREDHKGDAARAMFYFFTMYQVIADVDFWNIQKVLLYQWHQNDPVDDWEYERTWAIAEYQEDMPNPFVIDSTLARRIWFYTPAGLSGIIVTEIMQDPYAVFDYDGEWFEIYNYDTENYDLRGWTIKDNGTNSHVITGDDPVNIEPGDYFLMGKNSDFSLNGGIEPDYEYTAFTLANSDDEIIILNSDGFEVCRVEYDGGPEFPDPTGASMALLDLESDINYGANWTESTTPYGDGDLGTPGEANWDVSVDDEESLPSEMILMTAHPNPFNPTTTIRLDIAVETHRNTSLQIYDISGSIVEELVTAELVAGKHEIIWNGSNLPSSIYFVVLSVGNNKIVQKITLLK